MAYFKETKSATMKISKIFFSKNGVCKSRIKSCFLNKSVHYSWKLHGQVNYLIKTGVVFFLLFTLVNVYVDLAVFSRIAGTS